MAIDAVIVEKKASAELEQGRKNITVCVEDLTRV